jgi:hypothetical protein
VDQHEEADVEERCAQERVLDGFALALLKRISWVVLDDKRNKITKHNNKISTPRTNLFHHFYFLRKLDFVYTSTCDEQTHKIITFEILFVEI